MKLSARLVGFLVASASAQGHAPGHAPGTAPDSAPSPAEAPSNRNHLLDLAPIAAKQFVSGFANPFRQYEGGSIPGWHFGGDATLLNDYLALTPAAPQRVGWAWSTEVLDLDSSWEVELEFHVGGAVSRGSGGGLAFWWAAEPAMPGKIYGHADNFNGLGIFFDTYEAPMPVATGAGSPPAPAAEPYIVAMVNDGTPLGDDVLRDGEKLATKQVAVCFAAYRNLAHIARMRVAWTGGQLRLWLDLEHTKTYQLCLETALNDHRMASLPKSGYLGLSASTGAYGDAHVVYSMAAAKLDAKHPEQERIATPHVAALDEAPLDPSHEVHTEAVDHATHMPIVPNEVPPEHHAEKGDEPQHPTPVHVPPTQSENEQLQHAIAAMERSHEIADALHEVQEELGHLAHAHAGKSQELLDEMKHLQETVLKTAQVGASPGAPHAPVEEAGGGGALTPLTSKVEHTSRLLDEQTKVLQSLSEKITALTADEKQAASDAASAKQTLLGHVETVEKVLSAHTSTLNAHVTKLEEGMTTLTRQGHQTSEHVSAETKVIKTLVEKTSSGGGGSMVFPLAVCAQALVVAALLFYASAGGGKSRRSHLP